MIKNIKVYHLKLPIKGGTFKKKKIIAVLGFAINWLNSRHLNSCSWKATLNFVSIRKHFDEALGTKQI